MIGDTNYICHAQPKSCKTPSDTTADSAPNLMPKEGTALLYVPIENLQVQAETSTTQ